MKALFLAFSLVTTTPTVAPAQMFSSDLAAGYRAEALAWERNADIERAYRIEAYDLLRQCHEQPPVTVTRTVTESVTPWWVWALVGGVAVGAGVAGYGVAKAVGQ